ncbi:MAG: SDR family NAD(P)-dependent oxidoreductase [Pyrinomonadaceae bacterium]
MTLKGKKALVTGSSRGIGCAIARDLARQGVAIAINYCQSHEAAAAVAADITSFGGQAICLRGDVCDGGDVQRLAQATFDQLGGLDILINNVGEFFFAPLSRTTESDLERVLRSNVGSVFLLCKAVLPFMRHQGGGCIVNVGLSPVDRVRGAPNVAAYSIAKTGVLILTRTLASEEACHNIRVNCVSPGLIDNGNLPTAQRTWMMKRVPMGRLGTAEEVAQAVSFLVSDQASYISGANLAVSGAWDWEDRPTGCDSIVEGLFCADEDAKAN